MRHLIFISLMMVLASCLDDKVEPDMELEFINHPCFDSLLTLYNMIPYDGRELEDCDERILMYIYQEDPWFDLIAPCITWAGVPITDCSTEAASLDYDDFYANADYRGVVGIHDD